MFNTDIAHQSLPRSICRSNADKKTGRNSLYAVKEQVKNFTAVSLEQMKCVQLMDRMDRKFVVPLSSLPEILTILAPFYHIQEINDNRLASYLTIYYDTVDFLFYHAHVNGKLNRDKIRIREYADNNLSFLEIKKKDNKGRTRKYRIPENQIRPNNFLFIRKHVPYMDPSTLQSKLVNNFQRITLANKNFTERLTIDINISLRGINQYRQIIIPDLCIIEIKQNRFVPSPMKNLLNKYRFKATGISKYCLGISLTNQHVKTNNYKRKIHFLKKHIQL